MQDNEDDRNGLGRAIQRNTSPSLRESLQCELNGQNETVALLKDLRRRCFRGGFWKSSQAPASDPVVAMGGLGARLGEHREASPVCHGGYCCTAGARRRC